MDTKRVDISQFDDDLRFLANPALLKSEIITRIQQGKLTHRGLDRALKSGSAKKQALDPYVLDFTVWIRDLLYHGKDFTLWTLENLVDIDSNVGEGQIWFKFPKIDEARALYKARRPEITATDILGLGQQRLKPSQQDHWTSQKTHVQLELPADKLVTDAQGNTLPVIPEHEMYHLHSKVAPTFWKRVYPKIYKHADKWHDVRHVAVAASSAMAFAAMNAAPGANLRFTADVNTNETIALERAMIAMKMADHNMPLFFVDPELVQAAWHTDPPDVIDWKRMKLPYEAAAFILPKGAVKDPRGFDLPFVMFGRVKKDETSLMRLDNREIELSVENDAFLISAMVTGIWIDVFRELVAPYRVAEEFDHMMALTNYYAQEGTALNMGDKDRDFNVRMCNFVFNLLLIMQERHESVKVQPSKRVGFHKKSRIELWTPNVIGHGYKIIKVSDASGAAQGTKRWHWRRGHWRSQGHGPLHCINCTMENHGRQYHDRDTKMCKVTDCGCTGAEYQHESHYDKWMPTMLIAWKEEDANGGTADS